MMMRFILTDGRSFMADPASEEDPPEHVIHAAEQFRERVLAPVMVLKDSQDRWVVIASDRITMVMVD